MGYEVYLPSFADGNGDGRGDLSGGRGRLDHLQQLGVDLLWLTPFYLSPQRDQGYDVADPCVVDPPYGDLLEFDALLHDAHARGMRVLIDVTGVASVFIGRVARPSTGCSSATAPRKRSHGRDRPRSPRRSWPTSCSPRRSPAPAGTPWPPAARR